MLDQNLLTEFKAIVKGKYATLIGFFIEDSQKYIDTILKEVNAGNLHNAASAAHTLKSSSRQVGATELGMLAEDIEKYSRQGITPPDAQKKMQDLQEIFTKTIVALKSTL